MCVGENVIYFFNSSFNCFQAWFFYRSTSHCLQWFRFYSERRWFDCNKCPCCVGQTSQ